MTQAIEAAITAISGVVAGVSGIVAAPNYPSDIQSDGPFAAIYLSTGTLALGAVGTKRDLINITVDVLVRRTDLASNLATLTPLIDTVSLALANEVSGSGQRFSGTISTFESIQLSLLPNIDYSGVQHIGYRFNMQNVKILVSL